jgi:ribonuclease HII
MSPARPSRPARQTAPSLRHERALLREGRTAVAGVDEVGRGALSGPVSVGIVVVTAETGSAPAGVRDSKLLTPAARARLAPRIRRWAPAWAVGHAGPEEIDAVGIMAAMRMAAQRAFAALEVRPDVLLLDGNHDYISPRDGGADADYGLFELDQPAPLPPVVTRIKADMTCSAVAAASVLAKTARDQLMQALALDHPAYCWEDNKGYASPEHMDALRVLGPSPHHRISWRLPGAASLSELELPLLESADVTLARVPEEMER